jgi:gliding motility-associated lipoprotein GldD
MRNKQLIISCCLVIFTGLILACNSDYSIGKKKGYFRIDFPEKKYQSFNMPGYPYSFEYPVYATVTKDSMFFEDKAGDWWINVDIPRFGGRIHVSYKQIGPQNLFDSLVDDAFKLAYRKHVDVSSGIEETVIQTPNNIGGMYFELGGNTATANQFFLTDTTKHFLRGALYFDAAPNADSLGIVNDFLKKDLLHLINTLKWKP